MTSQTCNWTGKSESSYKYHIHPLPPNFAKKQPGNYIFAKESSPGIWTPIYIGETQDLGERFDSHHKTKCIERKGATHIHVHLNHGGEEKRRAEESDLLERYTNAKEPTGCNG